MVAETLIVNTLLASGVSFGFPFVLLGIKKVYLALPEQQMDLP